MAVTLKIIAERAGLSQSTVSQILNRKANDFSSEKTRQMVFQLANDLGYKQKFGHKLLRGDKTRTVAILLGMNRVALEEQVQALILKLLDRLENRNYSAYVVTLCDSTEKNIETVRELICRGTESFIFLGCPVGAAELEQYILSEKRTLIGCDSGFTRKVAVESSDSVAEILRFFVDSGHENFRFFLGSPPLRERLTGLCKAFPKTPVEELLKKYMVDLGGLEDHNDIDSFTTLGYECTRRAFEADPNINACFYLSDYFAIGGVRYLMETGRKIGSEVLVAGFNNIYAVRSFPLPISSVAHDISALADALIENMGGRDPFEQRVPTHTIIRKQ